MRNNQIRHREQPHQVIIGGKGNLHQGCNIPFYKNIKTLDDDAFNKIRQKDQTYFGSILCQFMNKCLTKGNIVEGIHLPNYERDSIMENIQQTYNLIEPKEQEKIFISFLPVIPFTPEENNDYINIKSVIVIQIPKHRGYKHLQGNQIFPVKYEKLFTIRVPYRQLWIIHQMLSQFLLQTKCFDLVEPYKPISKAIYRIFVLNSSQIEFHDLQEIINKIKQGRKEEHGDIDIKCQEVTQKLLPQIKLSFPKLKKLRQSCSNEFMIPKHKIFQKLPCGLCLFSNKLLSVFCYTLLQRMNRLSEKFQFIGEQKKKKIQQEN